MSRRWVTVRRRVRFVETDAAGLVHYSNYFRFMEEAEVEFWRRLGGSYRQDEQGGALVWPRIEAQCQYLHPLRFDELFETRLRLVACDERTVQMGCHIVRLDEGGPRYVARGRVRAACARVEPVSGRVEAVPIPPSLGRLLRQCLADRGGGRR